MSDDANAIDFTVLDRYRSGELSAVERLDVERWLAADASRIELVAWTAALSRAAKALPEPWDADRLWARLDASRTAPAHHLPMRGRSVWRTVLQVAAIVVVAIGGWSLWRLEATRSAAPAQPSTQRFATKPGERTRIRLADGSLVVLGAMSRLEVRDFHASRTRDVVLAGQAYFEVAHDREHPFRVHAGGAVTRVLGTKFGVEATAADSAVTVVVAEGSVAFEDGRTAFTRGDLARRRGHLVELQRGVDPSRYLSWTEGRLVFVNQPLRDVVPALERWYDLEIRLADSSLGDRLFTATLLDERAPEVLDLLARSAALRVERQGDSGRLVTLFPK